MPVTAGIATSHRFMFGGCGLGAGIAALEGTTGRPIVWATAQYLSFAEVGTVVDVDVTIAVEGRYTTQARAVCHVGGTEIITVNAALGRRERAAEIHYGELPEVQPPSACPRRTSRTEADDGIDSRLEQRWALAPGADGPDVIGPGRVAVWARMPELLAPSAASLAVLGDYVPLGISFVHDEDTSSTSLDNTLRVLAAVPSEWYLLDIRVDGLRRGFGHGDIHIWSQDGTLCAIGSQSCIVRQRPDQPRKPRRVASAPGSDA